MFGRHNLCFLVFVATAVTSVKSNEIRQKRIVDGEPYAKGKYPYHVSIWNTEENSHICGGVLIDKSWVLTAAHCFDNKDESRSDVDLTMFRVYANIYKQTEAHTEAVQRQITRIEKHEDYNRFTKKADIALLRLNQQVNSVRLARYNTDSACPFVDGSVGAEYLWGSNDNLTIIGWGASESGGVDSILPRELITRQGTQTYCTGVVEFYLTESNVKFDDTNLCIIFSGVNSSYKCSDDSGSPILATCGGKQVVVGILSSPLEGEGTCGAVMGPLNTKVSWVASWINTTLSDSSRS